MSIAQRKSRSFSDLSLLFGINSFTRDVDKKNNEEAIKAAVKHLVLTKNYERPFHPEIGCQLYGLLFENFDPFTIEVMKRTIEYVITAYEPRVDLLGVRLRENVDSNEIEATIEFKIKNTEKPIIVTTAITRVR